MKKQFIWLSLLLVMVFVTCKHEPTEVPNIGGETFDTIGVPIPNLPTSNLVCFTTQILPIYQTNCSMRSGCHVGPYGRDGIVLTDFNNIKANLTKSMKVIPKGEMPQIPYPKLDPAVIALLNKWIAEGANYTDCYNSNCDTTLVSYTQHIAPLMSNYCRGCHNATDANGGIKLDSYNEVKQNTQGGKVLCTVTGKGCRFMPKGGIHIGLCNLRKIQKWVEAGCPQ